MATAVVALVAGSVVLATERGTERHRRWGFVYLAALAVMALSSFGIYELRDGPSAFHVISVAVLVVAAAGALQPSRRRTTPSWRMRHAVLMQVSFLMLVITGVAQFFDRLPLPNDALNAVVFLQVPLIAGLVGIIRSARRI